MTYLDLDADIVELVPCPAAARLSAPLREIAFRADAWTPAETDALRRLFGQDASLDQMAASIGRGRAGVADKITTLGLRRNSTRPWTSLEDEEMARRYGSDATADISSDFGRSCSAVYARAGILGLAEATAPVWSPWEDAQLRAGYEQGVPAMQIATLVGRSIGGLSTRAGTLGIVHANHPPGWSAAETARALELAEAGHRYTLIIETLVEEGYPRRTIAGFGPVVRRLGYGRGWGRSWTPEEDELLTKAYTDGASLTPLRSRLGRTVFSIRHRADHLELRGTHSRRNGWRAGPDWTKADQDLLRAEYGKTPSVELATQLGRSKAAMMCRANLLGLVHGYIRPFSDIETKALEIAFGHNVAIADLAAALGRKAFSVSKYATKHGYRFGRRPIGFPRPSLDDILALGVSPSAVVARQRGEAVTIDAPSARSSAAGRGVVAIVGNDRSGDEREQGSRHHRVRIGRSSSDRVADRVQRRERFRVSSRRRKAEPIQSCT